MSPDNKMQTEIDWLRQEFDKLKNELNDGRAVPSGGTDEQILAKASDDDFDTEWIDQPSSGGQLPVGSIYINADDDTNPGTLLGYGTWTAFGTGRVLVGLDSGDTDFDTAEETGGEKEVTLTDSQMPSHHHNVPSHISDSGNGVAAHTRGNVTSGDVSGHSSGNTDVKGSDEAHNNLQPYIVVYMWKRTA